MSGKIRVVSVNVGLPQDLAWKGNIVQSGIFKEPKQGRIVCTSLNLEGDRQADLTVHGGTHKAIYGYPHEHYEHWRSFLGGSSLPFGSLGENLTLQGMTEDDVHLGDRFRIGTAEVVVTQPRQPCFKLAAKFGRTDIVREMLETGYSGYYSAVVKTGELGSNDLVELIARNRQTVSISDMNLIISGETDDLALMRRAVLVDALPPEWREALARRIGQDE